jgi:PAS domain S-box-containing protein
LTADITLLVFAIIGSRIARDAQINVTELRTIINQLSAANLAVTESAATLQESEERFRRMADNAPVLIWISGPDKRCTFFNKPWLDFTGRTTDQEMGNGWTEGVHPDDLERCLATYTSSFDARRGFQMEYRLRRFDGEYRWLLDTGVPRYREGEFTGYIGSGIDVTERKLMEERLRANEARLMDAQRLAKIGSWELDPETGRLHWSDEMFRIFGVPRGAQPDFDLFLAHVHPKDMEMIVESRATVVASPTPVDLEFRIVRRDGNVRFIRSTVQAIKNDLGALLGFVGATQDITEQILASQHLRESEASLRHAERIAHVGNWSWDLKTNQVSWSEEVFRIYGQPLDFMPTYEMFVESTAPQDRDRVDRWVGNCIAQKEGSWIEYRIVRPNGDLRTLRCTSEVLLDEEGMPARLFGTCQDITDARREQDESFARQKLESVGTLAGGIAHDFNNLLGGVLGQAELALSELETGSAPIEELKAIREVALRGSEVVRQLMIYAGRESETIGLIDLSRTVAEMVELLKISVSKHAVLVTDLGEDLPAVQANAAQIRRIVMNLVINASQAIGNRDGIVRLSTRRVAAAQATRLTNSAERDYVELEVSDDGCGISQEMQSKVFDPFFTTRSAGHGLGLAVVQGIVKNLGGTIHLASEPGKGTTFRILIPCVPAAAEETVGSPSSAADPPRELLEATVLVVEDEDVLRQAVAKVLRGIGAEVLEAANGSAAIDLLRTKGSQIQVIVLDLTIPGPSSQEVLAEAAQGQRDLKVILTSAYSERMAAASMGSPIVRSFIRKPFPLRDLVQTLRNVLSS